MSLLQPNLFSFFKFPELFKKPISAYNNIIKEHTNHFELINDDFICLCYTNDKDKIYNSICNITIKLDNSDQTEKIDCILSNGYINGICNIFNPIVAFKGYFCNNLPHGTGMIAINEGPAIEGNFINGNLFGQIKYHEFQYTHVIFEVYNDIIIPNSNYIYHINGYEIKSLFNLNTDAPFNICNLLTINMPFYMFYPFNNFTTIYKINGLQTSVNMINNLKFGQINALCSNGDTYAGTVFYNNSYLYTLKYNSIIIQNKLNIQNIDVNVTDFCVDIYNYFELCNVLSKIIIDKYTNWQKHNKNNYYNNYYYINDITKYSNCTMSEYFNNKNSKCSLLIKFFKNNIVIDVFSYFINDIIINPLIENINFLAHCKQPPQKNIFNQLPPIKINSNITPDINNMNTNYTENNNEIVVQNTKLYIEQDIKQQIKEITEDKNTKEIELSDSYNNKENIKENNIETSTETIEKNIVLDLEENTQNIGLDVKNDTNENIDLYAKEDNKESIKVNTEDDDQYIEENNDEDTEENNAQYIENTTEEDTEENNAQYIEESTEEDNIKDIKESIENIQMKTSENTSINDIINNIETKIIENPNNENKQIAKLSYSLLFKKSTNKMIDDFATCVDDMDGIDIYPPKIIKNEDTEFTVVSNKKRGNNKYKQQKNMQTKQNVNSYTKNNNVTQKNKDDYRKKTIFSEKSSYNELKVSFPNNTKKNKYSKETPINLKNIEHSRKKVSAKVAPLNNLDSILVNYNTNNITEAYLKAKISAKLKNNSNNNNDTQSSNSIIDNNINNITNEPIDNNLSKSQDSINSDNITNSEVKLDISCETLKSHTNDTIINNVNKENDEPTNSNKESDNSEQQNINAEINGENNNTISIKNKKKKHKKSKYCKCTICTNITCAHNYLQMITKNINNINNIDLFNVKQLVLYHTQYKNKEDAGLEHTEVKMLLQYADFEEHNIYKNDPDIIPNHKNKYFYFKGTAVNNMPYDGNLISPTCQDTLSKIDLKFKFTYKGSFNNCNMNGYGELKIPDSEYNITKIRIYTGIFKDNNIDGLGKLGYLFNNYNNVSNCDESLYWVNTVFVQNKINNNNIAITNASSPDCPFKLLTGGYFADNCFDRKKKQLSDSQTLINIKDKLNNVVSLKVDIINNNFEGDLTYTYHSYSSDEFELVGKVKDNHLNGKCRIIMKKYETEIDNCLLTTNFVCIDGYINRNDTIKTTITFNDPFGKSYYCSEALLNNNKELEGCMTFISSDLNNTMRFSFKNNKYLSDSEVIYTYQVDKTRYIFKASTAKYDIIPIITTDITTKVNIYNKSGELLYIYTGNIHGFELGTGSLKIVKNNIILNGNFDSKTVFIYNSVEKLEYEYEFINNGNLKITNGKSTGKCIINQFNNDIIAK